MVKLKHTPGLGLAALGPTKPQVTKPGLKTLVPGPQGAHVPADCRPGSLGPWVSRQGPDTPAHSP